MDDIEYESKFNEMQKYVPFLDRVIEKLKNSEQDKPRKAQLDKMQTLHSLLTNRQKKLKIETLLKCESVLKKLHAKIEKSDEANLSNPMNNMTISTIITSDVPKTLNPFKSASPINSKNKFVPNNNLIEIYTCPASPTQTGDEYFLPPVEIPTERQSSPVKLLSNPHLEHNSLKKIIEEPTNAYIMSSVARLANPFYSSNSEPTKSHIMSSVTRPSNRSTTYYNSNSNDAHHQYSDRPKTSRWPDSRDRAREASPSRRSDSRDRERGYTPSRLPDYRDRERENTPSRKPDTRDRERDYSPSPWSDCRDREREYSSSRKPDYRDRERDYSPSRKSDYRDQKRENPPSRKSDYRDRERAYTPSRLPDCRDRTREASPSRRSDSRDRARQVSPPRRPDSRDRARQLSPPRLPDSRDRARQVSPPRRSDSRDRARQVSPSFHNRSWPTSSNNARSNPQNRKESNVKYSSEEENWDEPDDDPIPTPKPIPKPTSPSNSMVDSETSSHTSRYNDVSNKSELEHPPPQHPPVFPIMPDINIDKDAYEKKLFHDTIYKYKTVDTPTVVLDSFMNPPPPEQISPAHSSSNVFNRLGEKVDEFENFRIEVKNDKMTTKAHKDLTHIPLPQTHYKPPPPLHLQFQTPPPKLPSVHMPPVHLPPPNIPPPNIPPPPPPFYLPPPPPPPPPLLSSVPTKPIVDVLKNPPLSAEEIDDLLNESLEAAIEKQNKLKSTDSTKGHKTTCLAAVRKKLAAISKPSSPSEESPTQTESKKQDEPFYRRGSTPSKTSINKMDTQTHPKEFVKPAIAQVIRHSAPSPQSPPPSIENVIERLALKYKPHKRRDSVSIETNYNLHSDKRPAAMKDSSFDLNLDNLGHVTRKESIVSPLRSSDPRVSKTISTPPLLTSPVTVPVVPNILPAINHFDPRLKNTRLPNQDQIPLKQFPSNKPYPPKIPSLLDLHLQNPANCVQSPKLAFNMSTPNRVDPRTKHNASTVYADKFNAERNDKTERMKYLESKKNKLPEPKTYGEYKQSRSRQQYVQEETKTHYSPESAPVTPPIQSMVPSTLDKMYRNADYGKEMGGTMNSFKIPKKPKPEVPKMDPNKNDTELKSDESKNESSKNLEETSSKLQEPTKKADEDIVKKSSKEIVKDIDEDFVKIPDLPKPVIVKKPDKDFIKIVEVDVFESIKNPEKISKSKEKPNEEEKPIEKQLKPDAKKLLKKQKEEEKPIEKQSKTDEKKLLKTEKPIQELTETTIESHTSEIEHIEPSVEKESLTCHSPRKDLLNDSEGNLVIDERENSPEPRVMPPRQLNSKKNPIKDNTPSPEIKTKDTSPANEEIEPEIKKTNKPKEEDKPRRIMTRRSTLMKEQSPTQIEEPKSRSSSPLRARCRSAADIFSPTTDNSVLSTQNIISGKRKTRASINFNEKNTRTPTPKAITPAASPAVADTPKKSAKPAPKGKAKKKSLLATENKSNNDEKNISEDGQICAVSSTTEGPHNETTTSTDSPLTPEEPSSSNANQPTAIVDAENKKKQEWLEGFLMSIVDPTTNKDRILDMLKSVLDDKKLQQVKEILYSPQKDESKNVASKAEESQDEEKQAKPRVTRTKKNELDRLNEDIRDMFICQGVVTATGRRMCTLAKDDTKEVKKKKIPPKSEKLPVDTSTPVVSKRRIRKAKVMISPLNMRALRSRAQIDRPHKKMPVLEPNTPIKLPGEGSCKKTVSDEDSSDSQSSTSETETKTSKSLKKKPVNIKSKNYVDSSDAQSSTSETETKTSKLSKKKPANIKRKISEDSSDSQSCTSETETKTSKSLKKNRVNIKSKNDVDSSDAESSASETENKKSKSFKKKRGNINSDKLSKTQTEDEMFKPIKKKPGPKSKRPPTPCSDSSDDDIELVHLKNKIKGMDEKKNKKVNEEIEIDLKKVELKKKNEKEEEIKNKKNNKQIKSTADQEEPSNKEEVDVKSKEKQDKTPASNKKEIKKKDEAEVEVKIKENKRQDIKINQTENKKTSELEVKFKNKSKLNKKLDDTVPDNENEIEMSSNNQKETKVKAATEVETKIKKNDVEVVEKKDELKTKSDEPEKMEESESETKHEKEVEIKITENTNQNNQKLEEDSEMLLKNTNPEWHTKSAYSSCCVICKEKARFIAPHYLVVHKDSEIYTSRLPPAVLEDMKLNIGNRALYSTHKKVQMGYNYRCPFCEFQATNTLRGWVEHFTIHTGEYGYKCSNCFKGINGCSHMTEHIKKYCPNAKKVNRDPINVRGPAILAYVCQMCNFVQLLRGGVIRHLEKHHGLTDEATIASIIEVKLIDVAGVPTMEDSKDSILVPEVSQVPSTILPPTDKSVLPLASISPVKPIESSILNDSNMEEFIIPCDPPVEKSIPSINPAKPIESSTSIDLSVDENITPCSNMDEFIIPCDVPMVLQERSNVMEIDDVLESNSSINKVSESEQKLDEPSMSIAEKFSQCLSPAKSKDSSTTIDDSNMEVFISSNLDSLNSMDLTEGLESIENDALNSTTDKVSELIHKPAERAISIADKLSQRISPTKPKESSITTNLNMDVFIQRDSASPSSMVLTERLKSIEKDDEVLASDSSAIKVSDLQKKPIQRRMTIADKLSLRFKNIEKLNKSDDAITEKIIKSVEAEKNTQKVVISDPLDVSTEETPSTSKTTQLPDAKSQSLNESDNLIIDEQITEDNDWSDESDEGNNNEEDDNENWEDIEITETKPESQKDKHKNKSIFQTLSRLYASIAPKKSSKKLKDKEKKRGGTPLPSEIGKAKKTTAPIIEKQLDSASATTTTTAIQSRIPSLSDFIPDSPGDSLDMLLTSNFNGLEGDSTNFPHLDLNDFNSPIFPLPEEQVNIQDAIALATDLDSAKYDVLGNLLPISSKPQQQNTSVLTSNIHKIGNFGFCLSNGSLKYYCMVKSCPFLYSDHPDGLQNHFILEHSSIKWNGYCHTCEKQISFGRIREMQHMLDVHSNTTIECVEEKPRIKFRRLSGDILSTDKPQVEIILDDDDILSIDKQQNEVSLIENQCAPSTPELSLSTMLQSEPKAMIQLKEPPALNMNIPLFKNVSKEFTITNVSQGVTDNDLSNLVFNNFDSTPGGLQISQVISLNAGGKSISPAPMTQMRPDLVTFERRNSPSHTELPATLREKDNQLQRASPKLNLINSTVQRTTPVVPTNPGPKQLNFVCCVERCKFSTNIRSVMNGHILFHIRSDNNRDALKCYICSFIGQDTHHYFQHMAQVHSKYEKPTATCSSTVELTQKIQDILRTTTTTTNQSESGPGEKKQQTNQPESKDIRLGTFWKKLRTVAEEIVEDTGMSESEVWRCIFYPECQVPVTEKDFQTHLATHTGHVPTSFPSISPGSSLNCPHCTVNYYRAAVLKAHMKTHSRHRYFCSVCSCTTLSNIQKHFKEVHNYSRIVNTLPLLLEENSDKQPLFIASEKELTETELMQFGEKLMADWERKKALYKTHFRPNEQYLLPINPIFNNQVYCSVCNYKTKVRTNMFRHLQLHNQDVDVGSVDPVNPVPCLEKNEKHFDKMLNLACSSNTGSSTKPKDTVKISIFVPDMRRYVCGHPGCKYLTITDQMLRSHLNALHGSEKGYQCPHCQEDICKKNMCAERIIQHLKFHGPKIYQCSECEYFHYTKHVVERHVHEKHSTAPFVNLLTYDRNDNETKKSTQLMPGRNVTTASGEFDSPELPATSSTPVNNSKSKWECAICKHHTVTWNQMISHANSAHNAKHQYQCVHCPFGSAHLAHIMDHIDSKHPTKTREAKYVFYKINETPQDKAADTRPLWSRNDPKRVRSIRGILMENEEDAERTQKIISNAGVDLDDDDDIEIIQATESESSMTPGGLGCFHCNFTCKEMSSLTNHWKTSHWIEKNSGTVAKIPFFFRIHTILKCPLCSYVGDHFTLKTHLSNVHNQDNFCAADPVLPNTCGHCPFLNPSKRIEILCLHYLREHKPTDVKNLSSTLLKKLLALGECQVYMQCYFCAEICADKSAIIEHEREHHKNSNFRYKQIKDEVIYRCGMCQYSSTNELATLRHMIDHYSDFSFCHFCKITQTNFNSYMQHCYAYHMKGLTNFKEIYRLDKLSEFLGQMLLIFPNGLIVTKKNLVHTQYGNPERINAIYDEICKKALEPRIPPLCMGSLMAKKSLEESSKLLLPPPPMTVTSKRIAKRRSTVAMSGEDRGLSDFLVPSGPQMKKKRKASICEDFSQPTAPLFSTITTKSSTNVERSAQRYEVLEAESEPQGFSFYGKKPESIDLSKIYTHIAIGDKYAPVSVKKFSLLFKINAKVVVKSMNLRKYQPKRPGNFSKPCPASKKKRIA